MKNKARLLGIAGSLRNARWGKGNDELIEDIKKIKDDKELISYLEKESSLHLENFLQSGRREGKSFSEIYKNLKKLPGNKGLSNSEVALAAALWAASKYNIDIDHISLSEYFPSNGKIRNPEELKEKLQSADGILLSGPVYFGDRASLAQELVEFIQRDAKLKNQLKGKLFGGITIGAKRNGGQETTLIYQLLDMLSLGMLGVGNDSDTTAQYGGTCHAGDVGTMFKDEYGLNTSKGIGRRMAKLISEFKLGGDIREKVNVLFLILQDSNGFARKNIEKIMSSSADKVNGTIIDICNLSISRCIACDICPTHIDLDEVYRCIINNPKDDFSELHKKLLNYDAIVPVVVSANDSSTVVSSYQKFIERTRYLRRGDYVFSDLLVAPMTFDEIGSQGYYSIRMLTSMIRHHTVLFNPIAGYYQDGNLWNESQVVSAFREFIDATKKVTVARLKGLTRKEITKYHPVGYVLSVNKDNEDEKLMKREAMIQDRNNRIEEDAKRRLVE
jgi:multimeric flavodoxin WrbA